MRGECGGGEARRSLSCVFPKIWDFNKGQPWALHRFGAGGQWIWVGVRNKGDESSGSVGKQAWLIFTIYFLEVINEGTC